MNSKASLRKKQIAALKQMLNLNVPFDEKKSEPVWKILVYDSCGQNIISPLLSVKELHEQGVTLHVQLHSDRDMIPDVPAVYFVMPTKENLDRIAQDFRTNTYDCYHLNFITPISRERLEELAKSALESGCESQVQKVYDQCLNFISLEDDMFVLKHSTDVISYYALNKGDIKDTEMEIMMDTLAENLFSVFVTLETIPVIASSKNNAAEMLAIKLDKKLRENFKDKKNTLFIHNPSVQRPVLILLDRNIDMATPLHHSWTYQALAHDVLDLSLNRVVVEESLGKSPAKGAKSKNKSCQLDSSDQFWMSHKGSPFPTVAEAIQEELDQIRSSEGEIKRLQSSMGLDSDSDAAFSLVTDNTAKLTSTVNSLPQLLEKKRIIDLHTTIATCILNCIKTRRLDHLFECEEKIMGRVTLDKSLMELLMDPEYGAPNDKLRLFLIYYLCSANVTELEVEKLSHVLQEAGCDISPFTYLKRWKSYSVMSAGLPAQYQGSGTRTINMFTKLMSQGSSFVMEGVKNLVVKKHNLPVTRVVDEIMEQKQSHQTDNFCYFDPKQLKPIDRLSQPFKNAVVFIVGGGNYIEYQNLIDYVRSKTHSSEEKSIIYGSSALYNAKQFLEQLSMLGKEL